MLDGLYNRAAAALDSSRCIVTVGLLQNTLDISHNLSGQLRQRFFMLSKLDFRRLY